MSAETPAPARLWFRGLAWDWPGGLPEASARFGAPVARLAGDLPPTRVLTLKDLQDRQPIQPGPPQAVGNVWLVYPGRRHVISASPSGKLIADDDGSPAWWLTEMLWMAVDQDEDHAVGRTTPVPAERRVQLVIDGAAYSAQADYFEAVGLHCSAALVKGVYYGAIRPIGEAAETRLVTR